jgi:predicted MFS family arabinose efflux permease
MDRFGTTADRPNPVDGARRVRRFQYATLPLLATCIIACAGYLLLFLIEDPRSKAMYPVTFLVGMGEIGTVIISVAMVAGEYVDPATRGTVAGAYSIFGALGIMLCTRIGGILFDQWTYTAPFLLMAGVHAIVAAISAVVLIHDIIARLKGSTLSDHVD